MHECIETVLEIHTNPARITAVPPDSDIQSKMFMIDGGVRRPRGHHPLLGYSLPCIAETAP